MSSSKSISDAIDQAIDGDAPLDPSEVPYYYARQAGPYAKYVGGSTPNAINKNQNVLGKVIKDNSPRWPGTGDPDPEPGDDADDVSYAAKQHGNPTKLNQAAYASMANGPFNMGMVHGIGSTGRGSGSPGQLGQAPYEQNSGNTLVATPNAWRQAGEGPEEYLEQFDPTPGTDKEHPIQSTTPATPNPKGTTTPIGPRDQFLRNMQHNADTASGANIPIIRVKSLRAYFHKINPLVGNTGKHYNDIYKNDPPEDWKAQDGQELP